VVIDATPHVTPVVAYWGERPHYYYQPDQPVQPSDPAPGKVTVTNAGTIVGGSGYAVVVTGGSAAIDNKGTIVGGVKLSSGDDVFTNSGTFVATKDSDFGAGTDSFVNSGVVAVRPATKAGTVSLLGLESFQNKGGLVDLRNETAGDTLVLSGKYVGSNNAMLGLDVAADGTKADRLVIGGAATGHTGILLAVGAGDATLVAKPVTLVSAGAGTASDAFSIANADIGFVHYGLGFDAATNSFGLTSRAGSSVHRLAEAGAAAQAIWRQSADAWSSHLAQLRDGGGVDQRVWGQAYGKVDTLRQSADGDDLGFRQDYYGFQAGADLAGKRSEDGQGVVLGLTGGYLSSHVTFRGGPERLRFDTENVGGYAALRSGPVFANLLGQYVHYHADASNGVEHWSGKIGGNGYGAEAEVGARLGGDRFFAEPVASLAWAKTDLDTLHALGQSVSFGNGSTLTGKIGARIGGTSDMGAGGKAVFYARASFVHDFHGRGSALLESGGTSDGVTGVRPGDYGEGAVGVNLITAGRLSGFIEGDADVGHSYKGGGGRVGIRFKL
jgi:outer membrane autotransporter protein